MLDASPLRPLPPRPPPPPPPPSHLADGKVTGDCAPTEYTYIVCTLRSIVQYIVVRGK